MQPFTELGALPGQTAATISEKKWGATVRPLPMQTFSIGTLASRIYQNNPRRVAVLIVNQSAVQVWWGFEASVTSSLGVAIASNGGSLYILADEDGELAAYDGFCIASAAGSTVNVLEIVRK